MSGPERSSKGAGDRTGGDVRVGDIRCVVESPRRNGAPEMAAHHSRMQRRVAPRRRAIAGLTVLAAALGVLVSPSASVRAAGPQAAAGTSAAKSGYWML